MVRNPTSLPLSLLVAASRDWGGGRSRDTSTYQRLHLQGGEGQEKCSPGQVSAVIFRVLEVIYLHRCCSAHV